MQNSDFRHHVNLHTHTVRCRHAVGSEREYIEKAIEEGLEVLGFSDHTPYPFPEGYYSGFRMHPEEQADYVRTLLDLKEEYADRIHILIGYEAEYYPAYFSDLIKMLTRYPVDYIILGQHLLDNEMTHIASGVRTEDPAILKKYVEQTCEGMKTGMFTYLAHPDLLYFAGDESVYCEENMRLINCAKELHIPLEINLLGIREQRHYPREKFFELCGEAGAPVCIGSDAHNPEAVYDTESRQKAMDLIRRYRLDLVEFPELVLLPGAVTTD